MNLFNKGTQKTVKQLNFYGTHMTAAYYWGFSLQEFKNMYIQPKTKTERLFKNATYFLCRP